MPDCPAKHVLSSRSPPASVLLPSPNPFLNTLRSVTIAGKCCVQLAKTADPEISAEEQELIRQLSSRRPKRQRELARKIVEMEERAKRCPCSGQGRVGCYGPGQ